MKVNAIMDVLNHQAEFALCQEKNVALVGGFGSGKSQGCVFRALQMLKVREYAVFVVIAPTNSLLNDVNIPDFREVFDYYNIKYDEQKVNKKFLVNSGGLRGEIWFRSADRPEKIVGFDATDINIDEHDINPVAKQEELWRKCLGRLRGAKNATISVTTTPEGFRHTYDLFEKQRIGPLIRARTQDNVYLPEDYIAELYRQYDERLVDQYVEGKFVNINGLAAYYSWNRDTHHQRIDKRQLLEQSEWIGVGWDFNVNKMCAELFVYRDSQSQFHFFDEFIIRGGDYDESPTQRMCRLIKEKYPKHIINAFPDSTGKRKTTNATQSDLAIIRKNGIRVKAKESNPFVRDRLAAFNAGLSGGRITVDCDACPDLAQDLDQVVRDQNGEIDKSDYLRTHSSDAAGYPIAYLAPLKSTYRGTIRR